MLPFKFSCVFVFGDALYIFYLGRATVGSMFVNTTQGDTFYYNSLFLYIEMYADHKAVETPVASSRPSNNASEFIY